MNNTEIILDYALVLGMLLWAVCVHGVIPLVILLTGGLFLLIGGVIIFGLGCGLGWLLDTLELDI